MFFIPISVDVPMERWPWVNWVVIAATSVISVAIWMFPGVRQSVPWLVAGGYGWFGLLGHLVVHGDLFHLFFNMLSLWVFGNAVCAKVGNLWFPLVYAGLGVASASWAYALDPRPVIGASGAISGLVGMYVMWYLLNDITCFYMFGLRPGTFSVSSFWVIGFWFVGDLWGALGERTGIAYMNHVTGMVWGAALATLLVALHVIVMDRDERSLLDVMGIDLGPKRQRRRRSLS